eukprot:Nitzschia sp. Nitz4//scaffold26_size159584//13064//14620//NITZ4_002466-RA/size159584-processed-gene-0.176-mRNA-1//1//CDS//3329545007//1441//frame0
MTGQLLCTFLVALLYYSPAQAFLSPATLFPLGSRSRSPLFSETESAAAATETGENVETAPTMSPLPDTVVPGVLTGRATLDLLNHAKENGYAIPAVNCVSSSSVNFALEAACRNRAPVMIQFSSGGAQFYAGKSMKSLEGAVAGALAGAQYVNTIASAYDVPVILHTDHCSKKLLPWLECMVQFNERHFLEEGVPLFSSHMLDLSEETVNENLRISSHYLQRMEKMGMLLEVELGITGGEEDGVNNSDRPEHELYTTPEDVYETYSRLGEISDMFTVAAAFGNVHGVYRPGNVKLDPEILHDAQEYICDQLGARAPKNRLPVNFVFHGGSGSSLADIRKAIRYGVIKMNIDTDTQWSYWDGMRKYIAATKENLQTQYGTDKEGRDLRYYHDPRNFFRAGEVSSVKRLSKTFSDLNCKDIVTSITPENSPLELEDKEENHQRFLRKLNAMLDEAGITD